MGAGHRTGAIRGNATPRGGIRTSQISQGASLRHHGENGHGASHQVDQRLRVQPNDHHHDHADDGRGQGEAR